ncbi:MAG: hypothetical protein ACAH11_12680 [Sphingomonas sp.]
MIRIAAACALACLTLTPSAVSAQQAGNNWVQVLLDRGVSMEIDVASVRTKGALRTIPVRMVAATSPRSMEMTFAVDCAAQTVGIDGDTRSYENGKLTGTETPPEDARAQQSVTGAPEFEKVIELTCAAKLKS